MKLHILGICGTFMGGVAALARELGHQVEGSDANVYPPMSTQLEALGIALHTGYDAAALTPAPDVVVVGNAMRRGYEAVEYMLDERLRYISGPQWLGEQVLACREVMAVAGTHGKTTTSSLLAHLMQAAGTEPGFLIGGVPGNFETSARLGKAEAPFVIEADEYDTAFFDKRSKFVHYRPHIAILNNLEFDHADIFPDVAAIQRQFHHLVRTVPGNGRLIVNAEDEHLAQVLAMGCWTPVETFGIERGDWRARLIEVDGSAFEVSRQGQVLGQVRWSQLGRHNVMNALAAIAAAAAHGVDPVSLLPALARFRNARRRMEPVGDAAGVQVYDDFAHHPTAIATTLAGLRAKVGNARILVALEPRSNSMRQGAHAAALAPSLADADVVVFLKRAELPWNAQAVVDALDGRAQAAPDVDALLNALAAQTRAGDHVVFMSNGGFENAPRRFAERMAARQTG
ncbi:UDP-N-acetylmuramate:L-alanyl-gamma-D-glutamyl-meso-diaminopimelate ligase [Oleiagrimonas sp. C23AA]|uniref:UDP-N-acetylmuramate:L-alanyl-gamma-D-glutamyl- meso-diaminopimelate ligase n=1 Tax=Oleiagrimonas sp. C23AA TaxID=2719047 RepID=UPI0014243DCF|nr:UDP-N-acetylmuramate:L-alanyl-gamma-D-glutamyl-meso-diaminopimelate ligase [Oleiagrimonas sp. C23AA]NII12279.1 UDP-N-acetylmuramate:L-alanyl-gamma-D-glutamyl-meso-diaminopimelate ligase [Oleiagrimonas sp. C23AA]